MLNLELIEHTSPNPSLEIKLIGPIDETAGKVLAALHGQKNKSYNFNFHQVEYVNSLGIRNWINFIRHFQENRNIVFSECPPDIVMQMNMMPMFQGSGKIESFYVGYECDNCGFDGRVRFESSLGRDQLSEKFDSLECEQCKGDAELEEDKDHFLTFLDRQN